MGLDWGMSFAMNERWSWIIRYGIVITLLAVIPYALSQYVTFVHVTW